MMIHLKSEISTNNVQEAVHHNLILVILYLSYMNKIMFLTCFDLVQMFVWIVVPIKAALISPVRDLYLAFITGIEP